MTTYLGYMAITGDKMEPGDSFVNDPGAFPAPQTKKVADIVADTPRGTSNGWRVAVLDNGGQVPISASLTYYIKRKEA